MLQRLVHAVISLSVSARTIVAAVHVHARLADLRSSTCVYVCVCVCVCMFCVLCECVPQVGMVHDGCGICYHVMDM